MKNGSTSVSRLILKKRVLGGLFFALAIFLMCVLKLWYALPVILGVGLLLTALHRKKSYCYYLCPLGNTQDFVWEKSDRKPRNFRTIEIIRKIVLISFWLYMAVVLFLFWNEKFEIWALLLRLALLSFVSAIVLQYFFGKRYWCSNLCPLGYCMNQILKKRTITG